MTSRDTLAHGGISVVDGKPVLPCTIPKRVSTLEAGRAMVQQYAEFGHLLNRDQQGDFNSLATVYGASGGALRIEDHPLYRSSLPFEDTSYAIVYYMLLSVLYPRPHPKLDALLKIARGHILTAIMWPEKSAPISSNAEPLEPLQTPQARSMFDNLRPVAEFWNKENHDPWVRHAFGHYTTHLSARDAHDGPDGPDGTAMSVSGTSRASTPVSTYPAEQPWETETNHFRKLFSAAPGTKAVHTGPSADDEDRKIVLPGMSAQVKNIEIQARKPGVSARSLGVEKTAMPHPVPMPAHLENNSSARKDEYDARLSNIETRLEHLALTLEILRQEKQQPIRSPLSRDRVEALDAIRPRFRTGKAIRTPRMHDSSYSLADRWEAAKWPGEEGWW